MWLVMRLGIEPGGDVFYKTSFRQRFAEERLELSRDRHSVNSAGLLLRDSADCFFLNELALQGVDRCESIMPGLQLANIRANAEEFADEVFKVRREIDDQIRLLFSRKRGGIAAGCCQTIE